MGDLRVELRAADEGSGPAVLFIHGSAVDQRTWSIQRRLLHGVRKLFYDRRGTHAGEEHPPVSIEQHALDAAALIRSFCPGERIVVCGSSCGAVVALELLRAHPDVVRRGVLMEPPLPPRDGITLAPPGFMERFDALAREQGGSAAGAFFLRAVLGDEAYERMPRTQAERSAAQWQAIRRDSAALDAYAVRYPELAAIAQPVLLVGGERSAGVYGKTLHALQQALGNATLEFLAAGHMMHAEAHRRFNALLLEWCTTQDG